MEKNIYKYDGHQIDINPFLDSLNNGLIVIDTDFKVAIFNSRAEQFFLISKKKVTGEKISKFKALKYITDIFDEMAAHPRRSKMEVIYKPNKEEDIFIRLTTRVARDAKRKRIGYVMTARDETKERAVERLKNEFISIAAHQLRTPLSALRWIMETVLSGDLGKLTPELKEILNKADDSNKRMIALVNDLLNVSRIEEGRFLYDFKVDSIEELVKDIVSNCSTYANEQRVNLSLSIPTKKTPKIKVDGEKLNLAIRNLIDNAIKYSKPGDTVKIRIKTLKKKGGVVQIAVKDKGIGINKKDQKKIFSKFFRAENAARFKTEGTGLGLFIVKSIVEASGGRIFFESDKKRGTTFYIELSINNH